MSRLGPTGIAAISVGTILVVLLIVQVWIYLSRDSKNAGGKPSGDNPSNSQIVPSNSGPSGVDSRRSSRDPRADSGNGSRAQLPPFAGNETQRNRPQDNPSANDAGSTTPGGEDRNADSRNRNTVNPPDPPDRARTTPPPPAPDPEPAQWDATLQKGRHYVVVAHYRKVDLPQAQDAAAFLQQRGIQCVIHEIKNAYMVVATQPFLINQKDTAARKAQQARADEFKRKIKALGKEHSRGSGNAFDQCYERLF